MKKNVLALCTVLSIASGLFLTSCSKPVACKKSNMTFKEALEAYTLEEYQNNNKLLNCIADSELENDDETIIPNSVIDKLSKNDKKLLILEMGFSFKNAFSDFSIENNALEPTISLDIEPAAPVVPTTNYKKVPISEESIDGVFDVVKSWDDNDYYELGSGIYYQTREGVDYNVFMGVINDMDCLSGNYPCYVIAENAYKFNDKYVITASTSENGNACPVTTYTFVFNTKTEELTGKTQIDGCSEHVKSTVQGNKLIIQKDGSPTVIYNAEI